ncbi:MAG: DnaJ domain-containing protein [Bacteroidota bacterium]
MGIFDRARRIAESYWNDNTSRNVNLPPDSDEEELRRIIDELSSDEGKKKRDDESFKNDFKNKSQNPDAAKLKSALSVLGISESATIDEIKSAFKKKMREFHPDKVATQKEEKQAAAHKKAQEISEAYQFLKTQKGF